MQNNQRDALRRKMPISCTVRLATDKSLARYQLRQLKNKLANDSQSNTDVLQLCTLINTLCADCHEGHERVIDLSDVGALIATDNRFSADDRVELLLSLPDQTITLLATVVRFTSDSTHHNVALTFDETSGELTRYLWTLDKQ